MQRLIIFLSTALILFMHSCSNGNDKTNETSGNDTAGTTAQHVTDTQSTGNGGQTQTDKLTDSAAKTDDAGWIPGWY